MDDRELENGSSISKELLKAIEGSQVAIIIFSVNYAASTWCLDEVVKIMDCNIQYKQMVIPVFYNVDPSTVRYQMRSFTEVFVKHELRFKDDVEGMQKVQRWRTALTAAANLSGHDIRDKSESDCIKQIVDQISSKLYKTPLPYLQDVVGIDTHLEKVKSLLETDINDVRIVGIWGMGGVGKTTIANAIYKRLFSEFDVGCFLGDVKENKGGIHSLQNILLSELLGEKIGCLNNKENGKDQMARRLRLKKALVVLDDIDHKDHLDYLAGDRRWFGKGSRIIITTRNKHLIGKDDIVYELTTLPDDEAIHLFNHHAFGNELPDEHFKKLSLEVVNHAKGLPLALKVWGSLLHNRGLPEWQSAVDRIKKISSSEVVEKLRISYDGLECEEKEVFLDIACFFRGYPKERVKQILESCEFRADIGLDVLVAKSLVFIKGSKYGGDTIEMHDLIQEMGKYVVNMQKNPGGRSRIWDNGDLEVISNSVGTKAVEAIFLRNLPNQWSCENALNNMNILRMLHITQFVGDFSIKDVDGSIQYLSNSLRWFVFKYYPWKSVPANFEPKRLIHLELHYSSLCHLWTETKDLRCLRTLDLNCSKRLKRTPDFTGMPNLEYVDLGYCTSLEEVHSSLGNCHKLIRLHLHNCKSLTRFPHVNVESLEFLDLRYCNSLEEFPEISGRMKLDLDVFKNTEGSRIRELPSSIQYQTHLTKLDLSSFNNLENLPKEIGYLVNLEWLDARSTLISLPPPSIVRLTKLKFLSFAKDEYEDEEEHFRFPPVAEGLKSLEELDLSWCNLIEGGLPRDIGCLSSLKKLNLTGNNFDHLPQSIGQLGALRCLNLSHCKRLKESPDFMGMPNLETLEMSNCTNLEEVHHSIGYLNELTKLDLSCCTRLKELPDFTGILNLETLDLSYCTNLEELHHSVGFLKKFTRLNLSCCQSLKRFPAVCIDSLEYLGLWECSSLEKFPEILGSMKLELEIHILGSVIRDLHLIYELRQNIPSDSMSRRLFTIESSEKKIPSWFEHQGMDKSVSINLPENWYECDNFLGVAVCYSGWLIETITELIPLSDDGMIHELVLFIYSKGDLCDRSEASGKTPDDYGLLMLSFFEIKEFGFRLLYKDERRMSCCYK